MTDVRKLEPAAIEDRLASLADWSLVDGKLHRELRFEDFVEAFGFMAKAAILAEKMDHHPEWSNVYNRVTIDLSTHDVDGVSRLDFELAESIDRLLD